MKLFGPQWGNKLQALPLTYDNLLLYYDLVHSPAIRADFKKLDAAIAQTRKAIRRKRSVRRTKT